jgi:spermidine synthase
LLTLFSFSLFLSALLLFVIQPVFGKMVLPLLGGSPSVWNTCMAFFQALLLGGYTYAHYTTKWLGVRRQFLLHLVLLSSVWFFLPVIVTPDWAPSSGTQPILHLLKMLLVILGMPFFVVSTTAPLMQKWFACTAHAEAQDPYFLYSASNAGSLVGLLGYLALWEPYLDVAQQAWIWSASYGLLAVLVISCGVMTWRSSGNSATAPDESKLSAAQNLSLEPEGQALTVKQRLEWILWSFCPSSLMLGITGFITTDIAAVPLFWVIPLTLYLLSFIIVFARHPVLRLDHTVGVQPFVLLPLCLLFLWGLAGEGLWVIPFHFLTFFIIALVCHGRLAQSRPATGYLTEFYLWMALGGVLGGVFNAFIAPLIFKQMVEYPLVIGLASFLYPAETFSNHREGPKTLGILLRGLLGLALLALVVGKVVLIYNHPGLSLVISVVLALICFSFVARPFLFGLAVTSLLVSSLFFSHENSELLFAERNFFGLLQVRSNAEYHYFYHGTTVHGGQSIDPSRRKEPVPYYCPSGPIGQVMETLAKDQPSARVAIVGLGAGGLASYATSGQYWTFYEIDPTVVSIATNPRYFTFLQDCSAKWEVVLDDARLTLAKAPDHQYHLIVLDAFNSDSVPVHLINREALRIYLKKLAPGGIIAFHISNRFLDLSEVLGNLSKDAGLESLVQFHHVSSEERNRYCGDTTWVVMARDPSDLEKLADKERWVELSAQPRIGVWNDNYINILSAFTLPEWGFLRKIGLQKADENSGDR